MRVKHESIFVSRPHMSQGRVNYIFTICLRINIGNTFHTIYRAAPAVKGYQQIWIAMVVE